MADTKLQNLIGTLMQQGVVKGEEAARDIVDKARQEAGKIVSQAQAQAEDILTRAKAEEALRLKQLQSAMEIAASQFATSLKAVLQENLLTLPVREKLDQDLADPEFLKKLMTKFVEAYAGDPEKKDIQLLLPQGAGEDLVRFAVELMAGHFAKGKGKAKKAEDLVGELSAQGIKFGFMVDRADGHVRLDFSDEAFLALFLRYLAPKFRELFKEIKLGGTAEK
ncbi:MAG: hypothetical protein AB1896_23935 [Thermodesulfobacteriota bacterium]